jgi:hypothetical protein
MDQKALFIAGFLADCAMAQSAAVAQQPDVSAPQLGLRRKNPDPDGRATVPKRSPSGTTAMRRSSNWSGRKLGSSYFNAEP